PVRGRGPVDFGLVLRGGGPSVTFFVGDEADDASLVGEWVAVHELSHLSMPFVERDAAWLSEGFATYYQNVLRARAGLMSAEAAWTELHEGFARGQAANVDADARGDDGDDERRSELHADLLERRGDRAARRRRAPRALEGRDVSRHGDGRARGVLRA
ncbi:hypothetical protein L6R52_29190, partial [Myxococcota bacterium]|nr:hypothetical protein [Myxococcota bacterium]